MKILTIDIGTGTQDIFLYDSQLDIENGFKLVLPSPTMMVHQRIKRATRQHDPIVLTGSIMGGGPSAWAAMDHVRAGIKTYATPAAAKTINDDLDKVARDGIILLSEDEAKQLPDTITRIKLQDFDLPAIYETFSRFGVDLSDLAAVAAAVFDHGHAPPEVSDRQFRFDYLDQRLQEKNSLTAFAYLPEDIPPIMTRLQAVAQSAPSMDCPLLVMDTAPAAVLGATFDPIVSSLEQKIVANIGNFHALAFRLGKQGIEGVFEHHTGEIDRPGIETLIKQLIAGTIQHEDVFNTMGHGALMYNQSAMSVHDRTFDLVVTGPRRAMFAGAPATHQLRPYFAVPFGDMMLAGCYGLLAAAADLLPDITEPVLKSLHRRADSGTAPWDIANP